MTNKRTLKKTIKMISEGLFAECAAVSLHAQASTLDNIQAVLFSIVRLQEDFTARISHPEPGMPAKDYFEDLREKFSAQASDLQDQIDNMN